MKLLLFILALTTIVMADTEAQLKKYTNNMIDEVETIIQYPGYIVDSDYEFSYRYDGGWVYLTEKQLTISNSDTDRRVTIPFNYSFNILNVNLTRSVKQLNGNYATRIVCNKTKYCIELEGNEYLEQDNVSDFTLYTSDKIESLLQIYFNRAKASSKF